MSWRTGISGWATVALAGLGLLALVGVCLRRPIAAPPRRGDAVEAVTSLAMQPPGVLPTTQNASAAGWHCNELQKPPPGGQCVVSILHISDTHGLHRQMAKKFTMPPADLLVHTGDITDMGTDAEMVDFNLWLDDIKHRYKYGVYLVSGNHDWMWALNRVAEKKVPPEAVIHPKYLQNKVTSAKVLHHEMVEVAGLRIFGSDWCPWFGYAAPGDYWKMEWSDDRGLIYDRWKQQVLRSGKMAPVPTHRYDEIPEGVDILLSHMAPWNIFDHTLEGNWGSSQALLGRIQQTKPKAHLFGHIHEMRGVGSAATRARPTGEVRNTNLCLGRSSRRSPRRPRSIPRI